MRWPSKTLLERFEDSFTRVPESGCWIWVSGHANYPQFYMPDGQQQLAHRVSWQLYRGQIHAGAHVLHKCDVPSCVNPAHLELGNAAKNSADAYDRGRTSRGERHPNAKLTASLVKEIRVSKLRLCELVRKYGMSRGALSYVLARKTWRHVA